MCYGTCLTYCLLKGLDHLSEVAALQTSFYHTHQRSGERFNKTLNGTKCQRNTAIITPEDFSLLSRKPFHYSFYILKAAEFSFEQWCIKQRNQKNSQGKANLCYQILCVCYPKKERLRGSRKNPSLKNRLLSLPHGEGRPDLYLEKIGIISF